MITGFNTDIDHRGRVFHVQTEEKGRENPVVESLIYCGGQIVTSRRSSYRDLIDADGYTEDAVLRRMERQHQSLIREIHDGKFDPEGALPFGHSIVSNRSLDEVVMEFLQQNQEREPIAVETLHSGQLLDPTRPSLQLQVLGRETRNPVGGARVTVRLAVEGEEPLELFCGATDETGSIEARFEMPEIEADEAVLLCEAEAVGARAEIRQALCRSGAGSASSA